MQCDFCLVREAVDHQFRVLDGFASVCERCKRLSIPPKDHKPSAGDFCCVTNDELTHPIKTAGIGDDDARPQGKVFND